MIRIGNRRDRIVRGFVPMDQIAQNIDVVLLAQFEIISRDQ